MYKFKKQAGVGNSAEVMTVTRDADNGGYEAAVDFFTGDEPLECTLWAGDNRAQAASPPISWLDAPGAVVKVEFPAEVMTMLDGPWYQGRVVRTDINQLLIRFRLDVEAGPGSAVRAPAYHTYADLTAELPWIGKLADYLEDQSEFAETAGEARRWIDAAILRSVPTQDWSRLPRICGYGYGYGSNRDYRGWGSGGAGGSTGQAQDPTIAAALDADQLMIATATGRRFVEASVYYTLYKILRRAVGMQTPNDVLAMSAQYKRDAEATLASCTAEIDTNADGVPEYVFELGRTQVRRA